MGTRSLTFIHDGDAAKPLTCMYRQYDGYPSGHGLELQQFLAPFKMVNGIGLPTDDMRIASGAGCLAAQMIAHFKDGPGGIYVCAPTTKDAWQEYEYHVHADDQSGIKVKCFAVGKRKNLLFEGSVEAFGEFCNRKEGD